MLILNSMTIYLKHRPPIDSSEKKIKLKYDYPSYQTILLCHLPLSSTSILTLYTALHPLTRLQLGTGFGVYWSKIRLEFIPQKQLSGMIHRLNANRSLLDQFGLETVKIDWDTPPSWLSQEWHRADCCSVTSRKVVEGMSLKSLTLAPCDDEDQTLLQIGSLLQMAPTANSLASSLEQACDGGRVYRLVYRNKALLDRLGQASTVFAFSQDDLVQLFRIDNTRNYPLECLDNTRTHTNSVVAAPEMDAVVNLLPDILFLSSMSTKTWTGDRLDEFCLDLDLNRTTTTTLCGRCGSGKTHVALLMAARSRLRPPHRATLYVDCKRLQQSSLPLSEILFQLQITFERAVRGHPCTIVLDELDRLAPNLLSNTKNGDNSASRVHAASPVVLDQSKIITDHILQLIQASGHIGRHSQTKTKNGSPDGPPDLSFVITCDSVESLHPDLLRSTIGECRIVQVPLLTTTERTAILGKMIRSGVSVEEWESVDHTRIARLSEGFRPRDLEKLASLVLRYRVTKRDLGSLDLVLQKAFHELVPLAHTSLANTERERGSGPNWQCLGGLYQVKAKLSSTILHPAKYRRIYEQSRIRLPRGVLLFGPTGSGKSVLVPALAEACSFPLITCHGPSVLDKYVGASEMKVRELFARAADVAPSILFLDELDSLAPRRGSDHTGVTDRGK
jgi:SpoVK/Ycf46/Vps4 family AAA+-type ATPase